jgi:hypothetical protein
VLGPGNTAARQRLAQHMFNSWAVEVGDSLPDPSLGKTCAAYVDSFASGFGKAAALIGPKTGLQSVAPGQK